MIFRQQNTTSPLYIKIQDGTDLNDKPYVVLQEITKGISKIKIVELETFEKFDIVSNDLKDLVPLLTQELKQ